MKIIMIAVSSINGKITQGVDSDIYKWTSKEDQEFFISKTREAKLIVMGSGTYETIREKLRNENGELRDENKLRVVLTSQPEKYAGEQVPGVLEFTSESPVELINRSINYTSMLLVGGSKINSAFAKAGLIDEIYLTVEPKVFGEGKPLFADENIQLNLHLESLEKLNEQGTMLLTYKVNK